MPLKLYNTLSGKEEVFTPIDPLNVGMYVCGITPYDETHLGHGRAYVTFDVIRRYLEYSGYKVKYIQNITDIDDKIINKSKQLSLSYKQIADKYMDSFFEVMGKLNVKRADKYPKATEHIKEMIELIKGLIEKDFAYVIDGSVYFSVSKFENYGKLSKRKTKDMLAGARVEIDERKKDPLDFALWKAAKEGEPSWGSPWGAGRPGWHIECSAMSTKYLGQPFDIHGGGLDLTFPHHENEIAQTEAATGKPFVKYWIHNGFVTVNKEKMSKSLGNFFTLKEILEKYDGETVRFFLLSTHYRSPINFSDKLLEEAKEALSRLYETLINLDLLIAKGEKRNINKMLRDDLSSYQKKFNEAMDNDFNTAAAIGVLFEIVHFSNKMTGKDLIDSGFLVGIRDLILMLGGVLGILQKEIKREEFPKEIEELIDEREKARAEKDFTRADEIRLKLAEEGIILEDTPTGVRLKRR
ncbi:MAG: cysteine--tRNA ligase [Candidatus Saganbacteria bacterium]|nr:cysteine--tRNA ligase [Candidatus Saganbacteria bacterium]